MESRFTRLFLNTRFSITALLVCSVLLQSGCSNLFFYPDKVTYITPDRLNLLYEDVYLETLDGETLHGWWLPAMTAEPAKGTVYFLHGNAQNISAHLLNAAWLPKRGYNVFAIDYRGYGQSTGSPDLEGALHDVEVGLRWLVDRDHRHDRPVHLLGQSLGGALGIALASKWSERDEKPRLNSVILDGTFSGFRYIAREKLDLAWLTWPFQIPLSWAITNDYEGKDKISKISPVPVMIIHSVRDGIVPFKHGLKLYEAAKQPKEFLRTDTAHTATFVIPAYREALLDFMDRHRHP